MMFLFGSRKEIFGCSFSILLLGSVFISPIVEAQHHRNRNIGNLLAAGLLAALLSMHATKGHGGNSVFARLGVASNRHSQQHQQQPRHHPQSQQATVLVPVPLSPPHHHQQLFSHQAARHPLLLSPSQPSPLFFRRPMIPLHMDWQANNLQNLATLRNVQARQAMVQQQMLPQLSPFAGLNNPLLNQMQSGIPSGMHPGIAAGMHPGLSSGIHPGVQHGIHPGLSSGMPNGLPNMHPGIPSNINPELPSGIESGMPNTPQMDRFDQQFAPSQLPDLNEINRMSQEIMNVREIHPHSPLAATIDNLINQLEQ